LLRLLGALGLIVPRGGRFHLTDQTRLYLVRSSPFYWGHMMRVGSNRRAVDRLIARLAEKGSAEAAGPEGTDPASNEGGMPADVWAAGRMSAEQARTITAGMHSHSLTAAVGTARNYDFSGVNRVLDVGGGSGCFMIAMAQAHPNLRCTIMEIEAVCETALSYIRAGEVEDRVDTLAIDMFRQDWPQGYDAIFFSNIWHDWNPRTCAFLARRAFEALPSRGRIMLHEMLLDDHGAGPATAAAFSLMMMLGTQGQQFTFEELRALLQQAGFDDVQAVQTAGHYSIVTGFRP
jgi:acetylserotonin N-methyltransferase